LALVLDFGHFSQGIPVNILEVGLSLGPLVGVIINSDIGNSTKVDTYELFLSEVSERCDALGIGLGFIGVVKLDFDKVLHENSFSIGLFIRG
jgi:hypothetical protein